MCIIQTTQCSNLFSALKLIEQLYIDGQISEFIFKQILREHADNINVADFCCTKSVAKKEEEKVCTDMDTE